MSEAPEEPLTVDEFLAWAETREGKFELHDGRVVKTPFEQVRHGLAKMETTVALQNAITTAKLPCRAYTGGITVRASLHRAFVPDALVVSLPPPHLDAVEIDNPLIVVEVLSPLSCAIDHNLKLEGYLSLKSLAHYLILDPVRRVVIHHARQDSARAATRLYHAGSLRLDPPGLELAVEELFGPEAA